MSASVMSDKLRFCVFNIGLRNVIKYYLEVMFSSSCDHLEPLILKPVQVGRLILNCGRIGSPPRDPRGKKLVACGFVVQHKVFHSFGFTFTYINGGL